MSRDFTKSPRVRQPCFVLMPATQNQRRASPLINGLLEPSDVYRIQGRNVTISTTLNRTDQITIRYRHSRGWPILCAFCKGWAFPDCRNNLGLLMPLSGAATLLSATD